MRCRCGMSRRRCGDVLECPTHLGTEWGPNPRSAALHFCQRRGACRVHGEGDRSERPGYDLRLRDGRAGDGEDLGAATTRLPRGRSLGPQGKELPAPAFERSLRLIGTRRKISRSFFPSANTSGVFELLKRNGARLVSPRQLWLFDSCGGASLNCRCQISGDQGWYKYSDNC